MSPEEVIKHKYILEEAMAKKLPYHLGAEPTAEALSAMIDGGKSLDIPTHSSLFDSTGRGAIEREIDGAAIRAVAKELAGTDDGEKEKRKPHRSKKRQITKVNTPASLEITLRRLAPLPETDPEAATALEILAKTHRQDLLIGRAHMGGGYAAPAIKPDHPYIKRLLAVVNKIADEPRFAAQGAKKLESFEAALDFFYSFVVNRDDYGFYTAEMAGIKILAPNGFLT